ncbi:MAG: hypothetical protein ACI8PV_000967 [Dinoroseobacter sp.]|jgi:hypothetical protein
MVVFWAAVEAVAGVVGRETQADGCCDLFKLGPCTQVT